MSRKESEKKFMLEVLQVYRTLPSLWKVKSEEYHNRQRKIEDYQVLLKKYKEYFPEGTLEELKKKLNTLRTGFRTELRKINRSTKSGAGLDDLYESQAWFMSAMMFLVDQETPAQSRTSLPMPQLVQSDAGGEQVVLQIEDQELEECNAGDVVIEGTDSSFVSVTSLPTPTPTKLLPPTRKRKLNKMPESERNELMIMAKAKLSEPDDRHLARAKAWAYELSQLDAQQELFATKAINDVLFEARCGQLYRDSVKINEATIQSTPSTSRCATPYFTVQPEGIPVYQAEDVQEVHDSGANGANALTLSQFFNTFNPNQ